MRIALTLMVASAGLAQTWAPLEPWTRGTLDIHQISTGRGNAAFFVLPDGTTLLVDAGAAGNGLPETDPHPDATKSPGQWIARYVKRFLPPAGLGALTLLQLKILPGRCRMEVLIEVIERISNRLPRRPDAACGGP